MTYASKSSLWTKNLNSEENLDDENSYESPLYLPKNISDLSSDRSQNLVRSSQSGSLNSEVERNLLAGVAKKS